MAETVPRESTLFRALSQKVLFSPVGTKYGLLSARDFCGFFGVYAIPVASAVLAEFAFPQTNKPTFATRLQGKRELIVYD